MEKSSALIVGLWLLAGTLIGIGMIDLIYRSAAAPAIETQRDGVFPKLPRPQAWHRIT